MTVRIAVECRDGRTRVGLRPGLLRAQRTLSTPDRCRLALVATQALLLGGDEVNLEVEVAAGAVLELVEVAGTVAYDGKGTASAWNTRIHVADAGRLIFAGQPFVVADGADVSRRLELDLGPGACALLRETLVLGRFGETGGRLHTETRVSVDGRPVLVEDFDLDPRSRALPGLLGSDRVLDTLLALGCTVPEARKPDAQQFRLPFQAGTVTRYLGTDAAASPLGRPGAVPTDLSTRPGGHVRAAVGGASAR